MLHRRRELLRMVQTIGFDQPGARVGGGARRGHSGELVQHRENLPGDRVDVRHPIHLPQIYLGRVVRQDGRRLAVIGHQPRRHRLPVVVGAAGEFVAPADVADARTFRRLEQVVITGTAIRATEPAGDPVDKRRVVDDQFNQLVVKIVV